MTKEDFMKEMDVAVKVGEFVGDAGELQIAKERVAAGLGRQPDRREQIYTERFVTGNRYPSVHQPVMDDETGDIAR